jgi:hypothetical protein
LIVVDQTCKTTSGPHSGSKTGWLPPCLAAGTLLVW